MDLFDRTEQVRTGAGEKAVLVHLELPDALGREDLDEFHHLVTSSGVEPVAEMVSKRDRPDPALFIGSGKAEELAALVREHHADVVLFNHALSAGQERNLERAVKCRVLDRTGLILDIFAQRARTHEGRLQVELAQLQHLSTRLVRGWTHLERQKGGIGLRGPGETQLETDRRLLRERIRSIQTRLDKVRKQRAQGRRARDRSETPLISLVGYTNAGKSTLFNALTTGDVYVADQLFATLDPTLRKVRVPGVGPAILADTVGFIRHLPHRLVQAFRATLEETVNASLLLHVTDCSAEERTPTWRRWTRCWRKSAPTRCRCCTSITKWTVSRRVRAWSVTSRACPGGCGCRPPPAKASTCSIRRSPNASPTAGWTAGCDCRPGRASCARGCTKPARCWMSRPPPTAACCCGCTSTGCTSSAC